jgi:hypothetical protein
VVRRQDRGLGLFGWIGPGSCCTSVGKVVRLEARLASRVSSSIACCMVTLTVNTLYCIMSADCGQSTASSWWIEGILAIPPDVARCGIEVCVGDYTRARAYRPYRLPFCRTQHAISRYIDTSVNLESLILVNEARLEMAKREPERINHTDHLPAELKCAIARYIDTPANQVSGSRQ